MSKLIKIDYDTPMVITRREQLVAKIITHSNRYKYENGQIPKVFINIYDSEQFFDDFEWYEKKFQFIVNRDLKVFTSKYMVVGFLAGFEIFVCYDYLELGEIFICQNFSELEIYFRKEKLNKIMSVL